MAKALETLEEHNWRTIGFFSGPVKNGIACPDCGEELVDGVLEGVESQLQTRCESGAVRQLTTQREVLILKLLKHKVKVTTQV